MLVNSNDLLEALRQEVRDVVPGTEANLRLRRRLEEAHLHIVSGGTDLNESARGFQHAYPVVFPWAVKSTNHVFTNVLPIDAGTASVTNNSAAVSLTDAIVGNVTGWYFRVANDPTVYRIQNHTTNAASVVLDSPYIKGSSAGVSYTIFKLDYTLALNDLLLPTSTILDTALQRIIPIVGIAEFHKYNLTTQVEKGEPTHFGLVKHDAVNKTITLRLNGYPDELRRYELAYVPYPANLFGDVNNDPIIPIGWREILVHYAAYKELVLRDDTRSKQHFQVAKDMFKDLVAHARQYQAKHDPLYGKVIGAVSVSPSLQYSRRGVR